MFTVWLVLSMGGVECDAVAICDEGEPSCDAVVLSCEAPVPLSACLSEAAAYTLADYATLVSLPEPLDAATNPHAFDHYPEPIYGLGCATNVRPGWPTAVVFDRDEMERMQ